MTTSLLLIDIQNDYFSGGKMELVGMEKAAKNSKRVLDWFREKQLPVYHIQHISTRPNATFFLPDTEGVNINDRVTPLTTEKVIQKNYPNSFRNTSLLEELRSKETKNLVIVGAMSHMCIDATTRAAFDYEFNCVVIEDACATRDVKFGEVIVPAQHVHAGFMGALAAVYAQVKTCKEYCE